MSNEPTIAALYRQYHVEIANTIAKKVECRDVARDLTQDVFERYVSATRRRRIRNPRAFLYRISRNLVVDHYRRLKSSRMLFDGRDGGDPADPAPTAEQSLVDQHRLEVFEAAVAQLPPLCRKVFLLRKIEGLSYREIACRLELSEAAVEKHVVRGLKSCRDRVDRVWKRDDA